MLYLYSITSLAQNRASKNYRIRKRRLIIEKYGGGCICCGENQYEFLVFDHVHNGGTKHRKELGGQPFYTTRWIIENNFPDSIQILCHNCNSAKGLYGACPHKGPVVEFNRLNTPK